MENGLLWKELYFKKMRKEFTEAQKRMTEKTFKDKSKIIPRKKKHKNTDVKEK